jgi:hypothetical protein
MKRSFKGSSVHLLRVAGLLAATAVACSSSDRPDGNGDKTGILAQALVPVNTTDVTDIEVTDDGCTSSADTVTFNATLTVVTTATARYDVGLFVGTDGIQAENGECTVFSLPAEPVPPFIALAGDECGDSQSSVTLEVPVTGITVDCADANADNELDIANCTSWQQNSDGACGGAEDVEPG